MPHSRTVGRSTGKTPAYRRIAQALREEIASELKPGDLIASEHSLAARFGVNRHTLRRGVDELVEDGLVVRQRGRGTVVLSTPIEFPLTVDKRFSDLVRKSGRTTSNRVLTKKISAAPQEAADALRLPAASEVAFLEQVRSAGDMPLAISRHWFPMPRFRVVLESYQDGSLHAFIQRHLGLTIQLHTAIVRASLPNADDALNLRISPKVPVLSVHLTDIDTATEAPVEFVEQVFRADATRLSVQPGPTAAINSLHDSTGS
ncbi:MAG: phosphonate metabolism transcriptional regulator PhnF [Planctomycetota bacterium]